MIIVTAYHDYSRSASRIRRRLGASKIREVPRSTKALIINWGSTKTFYTGPNFTILNNPAAVADCTNKLSFFVAMQQAGVSIPPFTTSAREAVEWVQKGDLVLGRQTVVGRGGRGIVQFDEDSIDTFLKCPLYTKYIKNKAEFRVHIFDGQIIDVQKKVLPRTIVRDESNIRVRSHRNGYIFARNDIEVPNQVLDVAMAAFQTMQTTRGLNFAAFDVIYNGYYNRAYVLEANTAPGLEGQTIESYVAAFERRIQQWKQENPA
jgi:glutathione synthase/RimK-type ligase-like ATP-grasp enzyme